MYICILNTDVNRHGTHYVEDIQLNVDVIQCGIQNDTCY